MNLQSRARWLALLALVPFVLLLGGGCATTPSSALESTRGGPQVIADPAMSGEFWRDQALEQVLPYWTRWGRDLENGGFHTFLDREWRPYGTTTWYPGMTARHVFSYSAAYMLTGEERYLDVARETVDFLLKHGWDKEYGGWYDEIDRSGLVVQESKSTFYQIYAITGLTMYYVATRDPAVRE